MKQEELVLNCGRLYARLAEDGYSADVISTNKWILEHFQKYCLAHGFNEITMPVAIQFLKEKYDIDYLTPTSGMQTVLRRPLLILFEFSESGNYCKTHQRGSTTEVPLIYADLFMRYREMVNQQRLCLSTKQVKIWVITCFLNYLTKKRITKIGQLRQDSVHAYMSTLEHYACATKRRFASALREAFNWMHENNMIDFSGHQVFPLIRQQPSNRILSYYTQDEIDRMVSVIDVNTDAGRRDMLIISLATILGLRAGDILNLKFENIDWNNNAINLIQGKTQRPLNLPLVDAVKFPLIDYIKNARRESQDNNYVLVTSYAPYTRVKCPASLHRIITRCMDKAGININGRHHGTHSMRHSLATNLMRNNVPLSSISNILGHASTSTTEHYLTVDEANLQQLSLEVPDEK